MIDSEHLKQNWTFPKDQKDAGSEAVL